MKWGIAASIIILGLFGLLVYNLTHHPVDSPTDRTTGEAIQKQTFPDDLEPLFEPIEPDADATSAYRKAVSRVRELPEGRSPTRRLKERLAEDLKDAMAAAKVADGLFDEAIPYAPMPQPELGNALARVPDLVLAYARGRYEVGKNAAATEATRAVWAFGYRLFRNSERLYNRRQGLGMLRAATRQLTTMGDRVGLDEKRIERWGSRIQEIHRIWRRKLRLVRSSKPHVGDLLHVAREDGDVTFRIAAILHLGVAKFAPGTPGNEQAIKRTIRQAVESDNPAIARAGKAAEAFTKEQLRRL